MKIPQTFTSKYLLIDKLHPKLHAFERVVWKNIHVLDNVLQKIYTSRRFIQKDIAVAIYCIYPQDYKIITSEFLNIFF